MVNQIYPNYNLIRVLRNMMNYHIKLTIIVPNKSLIPKFWNKEVKLIYFLLYK